MRVFSLFLAMLLFSCATNTTLPETGSRWTLQVSQLLELGGKPGARAALADAQSDGDTLEFAISRLALLSRVTHEFSRVAHLQARLENLRGAIGASEAQEPPPIDHPASLQPAQ